jgi:hypothetical protein
MAVLRVRRQRRRFADLQLSRSLQEPPFLKKNGARTERH